MSPMDGCVGSVAISGNQDRGFDAAAYPFIFFYVEVQFSSTIYMKIVRELY